MAEIARVAKPGAIFVVNEIYSHSMTNKIRKSALVERILYPKMQRTIYGSVKPYITEDERKLSESDIAEIMKTLEPPLFRKYFYFLVTRVIPDRFAAITKLDRITLRILQPIAYVLAGRVLFSARVVKSASNTVQ